jgi:hypothetical protein
MQKAARGGLLQMSGRTTPHYKKCSTNPPERTGPLPTTTNQGSRMDYRVSYEHSLASDPDVFIVQVPAQVITDVPATVPRALLPEFIADLIRQRSPRIGKIRNLRVL